MLIRDVVLHVLGFCFNFSNDFFLISYSSFLFFYQSILNTLQLSSNRVEMIIMIFYTILTFLVNPPFALIHPCMVVGPFTSENSSFFINLTFQVISQILEFFLKFLLKLIDSIMDIVHASDRMLFIFSNLSVSVIELLLHLSFVLNTSVLKNFECRWHVFHLRLQHC